MDLAKIRKKSGNPQPASNLVLSECRQITVEPVPVCSTETGPQTGAQALHIEPYRVEDRQNAVHDSMPKSVFISRDMDPLALIMSGRRSAGCDEYGREADDESVAGSAADYGEYLSVRVADELYGIDIMGIKEIIRPRDVTELPQAPRFLIGVISLRGLIVPVIDMHNRLGLRGMSDTGNRRIVVIRAGDGFVGLLVEEVIHVVRIAHSAIEAAATVLEGIDRDLVNGIGRSEGRIIILLNLEKIADINLS